MAFSKIVGLLVIPRKPRSIRRCSSPEANMLRRTLSSQTLCPASSSCCTLVLHDRLLMGGECELSKGDVGDVFRGEAVRLGDCGGRRRRRRTCRCRTSKPRSPTYLAQPSVAPASIDMRAVIAGGRTSSRYDCGCASKSSQQGIETTRVRRPLPSRIFFASTASETSEPGRDQNEVRACRLPHRRARRRPCSRRRRARRETEASAA